MPGDAVDEKHVEAAVRVPTPGQYRRAAASRRARFAAVTLSAAPP